MGSEKDDSHAELCHSENHAQGNGKAPGTMLVNPGNDDDRDLREIKAFLRDHGFDVTVDEIRRLRRVTTDNL